MSTGKTSHTRPLILLAGILAGIFTLAPSHLDASPGDGTFHNGEYGWRISVPSDFGLDNSLAPETIIFNLDSGGMITLESGLPELFFTEPHWASRGIARVMRFAAESVEITLIEPGQTGEGISFEDVSYIATSGEETVYGLMRLYGGPAGVILCYRDARQEFRDNLEDVKNFADTLYFPRLAELNAEGWMAIEEFTNSAYGYRISYPAFLRHDEILSFISFQFLGQGIIDVRAETHNGESPAKLLSQARAKIISEFRAFDYDVYDEITSIEETPIPFIEMKVDDNDDDRWIKRVRVFVLPKSLITMEFYCPRSEFIARNEVFSEMVDSFDFDPEWITIRPRDIIPIPIQDLYASSDYGWSEYTSPMPGFTLKYPDFLTIETLPDSVFFNYNFQTILTLIVETHPGMSPGESLNESSGNAVADFSVAWDFTRRHDSEGLTPGGWPYLEFYLDDNDPDESWTRLVRVVGFYEYAVRLEMYIPIELSEELVPLFAEIADSFQLSSGQETGIMAAETF